MPKYKYNQKVSLKVKVIRNHKKHSDFNLSNIFSKRNFALIVPLTVALFLVLQLVTPAMVNAGFIPNNKVKISMFGFVLSGTYSEPGGQPTGAGVIKNGNVGAYPEGSCLPVEIEVKNDDNKAGNIIVSPVYDYLDTTIGIYNLEKITTSLSGNPRDTADDLNDFSYSKTPLSSAISFNSTAGPISAAITGPFGGNDDGTTTISSTDTFRHYNIILSNVPSKATVYVILCARLGVDASLYSGGSSMSVRVAQDGAENVPIPVNQILALPSITLTKNVQGGSAAADQWTFNVSPAINGQSTYQIPNGQDTVVIENVSPDGNYTITESGPQGYTFVNGSGTNCVFNGSTAIASVAAGKPAINATCVFVNQFTLPPPSGSITIVKNSIPDDPQSFSFAGDLGEFVLSDGGTNPTNISFSGLSPATYNVSETQNTGWDLTDISCTGDTDQGSIVYLENGYVAIDLDDGEDIICTFENTKLPTLTVTKLLNPISDLGLFNILIDQVVQALDVGHNGTVGPIILDIGQHFVSETLGSNTDLDLDDYITSFEGDCNPDGSVTLGIDENKNCTITNIRKGTIVIEKDTIPDNDTDFEFTSQTLPLNQFFLDDDQDGTLPNTKTFNRLAPGSYDITETFNSNYITTVSCDDPDGGSVVTDNSVALDLDPGEAITCTFINAIKQGGIIITKETIPDGDQTQFNFTTNYSEPFSLSDDQSNFSGPLNPGIYSVSEELLQGWLLKSATCSDGSDPSEIHLSADETVSCLFTNIKQPRLGVHKVLIPENDPGVFELKIDGVNVGIGQQGSGTYFKTIDVGTHSISESAVFGTDLNDYVVSFGGDCGEDGNVTLVAGEEKVCTITNIRKGTIVIEKDTIPDNDTDFEFTSQTLPLNQFFLDDDQDGTLPNSQTFTQLTPGTYDVSETNNPNYETTVICSDGSNPNAISLDPGETVTCTFTNTFIEVPPLPSFDLAVNKEVDTSTPNPGNQITYTITATNNSNVSVADVFVNDILPTSVTFVEATTTQGIYDEVNGIWTIGTLSAGGSATLIIKAMVNSGTEGQSIVNEASVNSNDETFVDNNPDNNTDNATSNVPTPPPPPSGGGGGGGGLIYGTLIVKKMVINDEGGVKKAPDFIIRIKALNGSEVSGSPKSGSETGTNYNIPAGTYIISEDPVSGYTQSFSGDCSFDGTVTVVSGVTKTCTITNNDIAGMVSGAATTTPGEVLGEFVEKPEEPIQVLAEAGTPLSLRELIILIISLIGISGYVMAVKREETS